MYDPLGHFVYFESHGGFMPEDQCGRGRIARHHRLHFYQ